MDWSLAQTYYLVTSAAALVATAINLLLYWRNRPNRLRMTVDEALKPVLQRMDHAFDEIEELRDSQAKAEVAAKALDHEINGRLREVHSKLDSQAAQLSRIATLVEHIEKHDQAPTLHHRVTELSKTVHGVASAVAAQSGQINMIHTFLLQGKAGG